MAEGRLPVHPVAGTLVAAPPATPVLPAFGLLVVIALAVAIGAQGAFYPPGQRLVAVLLGCALVGAMRRGADPAVPHLRAVAGGAAALAAWAVVCGTVAGDVTRAFSTVALLAGTAVVVDACRRSTKAERELLGTAAVAVGAAAALAGWAGVAWHHPPWGLEDQGLWRASGTVTYPNATAGILAPLALLALARLAARGTETASWAERAAAVVLLTGLGATLSRGGAVSFAVGLVVLVALMGPRRALRASAPVALGAAVALAGLVPSMPISSGANPALAIAAVVGGIAVATWVARRPGRRLVAVAGGLAAVSIGVALASGAFGAVADRRFHVTSADRHGESVAAVRLVKSHPLFGVGPSWGRFAWTDHDGRPKLAQFAHNEYLQAAVELGVIGGLLLASLLASVGRLVWSGRAWAAAAWPGAAAGLIAVAVHAAFDFGWHVPAVALTGALLVGMSLPPNTRRQHEATSVDPDRRGGSDRRRGGTGSPSFPGGGDPLAGRLSP